MHPYREDLTGMKFGHLLAGAPAPKRGTSTMWLCLCVCGELTEAASGHLKSGHTTSCDCKNARYKHRQTSRAGSTPAYRVWQGARNRCRSSGNTKYADYGGRGIQFSILWDKFEDFLADMGNPEPGMELDRINNDGNYEPGNCRWVTRQQNLRNTRRNRNLTFQGETLCVSEWAIRIGLNRDALASRLRMGWTVEKALTTKRRPRG
jgi:hypothetical protein